MKKKNAPGLLGTVMVVGSTSTVFVAAAAGVCGMARLAAGSNVYFFALAKSFFAFWHW